MRILALDQSLTNTGFAIWDEGEALPRSGAWALCDGVHQRALAFVGLHRELATLHNDRPIDLIVHEKALKMPSDKLEKLIGLYGLVAHIESYARVKRISLISVSASAWRGTWFTGMEVAKGDDLKRLAIERARQFGMNPLSHDEAEACGILDHAMHLNKITPPWRVAHPFTATL
jgi:hypothetical protein